MEPEKRVRGDELAALRIDRNAAPPAPDRRRLLLGGAGLVAVVALLVAWGFSSGGPPEVKVEYAVQSGLTGDTAADRKSVV